MKLVDNLRIEAAMSGRTIETLQGKLPDEIQRAKKWIQDAWTDIQMAHIDWRFMFVESTHTVPINASVIEPTEFMAGQVAEWKVNTFRIAEAGQGRKDSQPLTYLDYFYKRDHDGLDITHPGKPGSFTIHPTTEAIHIAPASDTARILFYDYWRTPQVLEDDDHVPIIPPRYHPLIVFWALKTYGFHEAAPEAILKADASVRRLFSALEIDQLPEATTQGLTWGPDW
ncbi:MAG: hypothetical protein ABIQ39_13285 [Ilumatobacteraceae bacterium]